MNSCRFSGRRPITMQVGVWGDTGVKRSDRVGVAGATETEREEDMAERVGRKLSLLIFV